MQKLSKLISRLERIFIILSALSMLAIMFIVALDVLLRYFVHKPLGWSYDFINMYLMMILFYGALSYALSQNGHIAVDILHTKMSSRIRHLCLAIVYWAVFPVLITLFVMVFKSTMDSAIAKDVIAGNVEWIVWMSRIWAPLGAGLLLLRVVYNALGHSLSVMQSKDVIALPLVAGYEED